MKSPPIDSVHQLISRSAKEHPKVLAVVDDQQSLNYAELDRRSNQLAVHLQQQGITQEILVGLAMPPTTELIVALLAILKSGGAYLPLDPTYPLERLEFILTDAAPALLLTTQSLAAQLPVCSIPVLTLDALPNQIFNSEPTTFQQTSHPESLAYVIYTSGSTGNPKGVLLEHCGLTDMAQFHAKQFSLGPTSDFLQFASLCFDASVLEIFCTLTAGATLHLTAPANKTPGSPLIKTLQERKISHVLLPPSTLEVLPEASLPNLKTLISGGEPCTPDIASRWATGRQFINAYGPTEATVTATTWVCHQDDTLPPPIGHACENTQIYIMDPQGNPVPTGQPGELYLGGTGVARGYLNLPELTQEFFLPDPNQTNPNAKLYKTGDQVCQRPDGALEFLGRLDRQLKIRGYRIEPEEIETCLRTHPQVQEVAVHAVENATSHNSLTAYCIVEKKFDANTLRDWLQTRLPNYMLPTHYIPVDELPKSPVNKMDAAHLLQPSAPESANAHPPCSSQEAALVEIWSSVLGFEPIGPDDHFIELGGDSLLSARISEKAQQQGMDLSPQDILSYPTIGELIQLLAEG